MSVEPAPFSWPSPLAQRFAVVPPEPAEEAAVVAAGDGVLALLEHAANRNVAAIARAPSRGAVVNMRVLHMGARRCARAVGLLVTSSPSSPRVNGALPSCFRGVNATGKTERGVRMSRMPVRRP